jgi:hypothetical protein
MGAREVQERRSQRSGRSLNLFIAWGAVVLLSSSAALGYDKPEIKHGLVRF